MTLPAPHKTHEVTGHGGVPLHVPEWGDPTGPAILLVHGWSQAHPCWARQLSGALDDFRLIAPDLRGHGRSGKPEGAANYDNSTPWAGDIQAILDALDVHSAVLVGWSMGGWVVQDYLRIHGTARVAGFSLVGSTSKLGRHMQPEAMAKRDDPDLRAAGMMTGTLAEDLDATRTFVRACFHQQPKADDLANMVGYNMLCPQYVRFPARTRHEDYSAEIAKLDVPMLVQWGAQERLCVAPIPQDMLAENPQARGICYDKSGHSPFWEEADAFNTDLRAFAHACQKVPA